MLGSGGFVVGSCKKEVPKLKRCAQFFVGVSAQ